MIQDAIQVVSIQGGRGKPSASWASLALNKHGSLTFPHRGKSLELPKPRSSAEAEETDGGRRGPNLLRLPGSCFSLPAYSAVAERQTQNRVRNPYAFRARTEGRAWASPHSGRDTAVQDEPGSVSATRSVVGEMQRLRGEVRSAPAGGRGRRLWSGRGEDGGAGPWAPARAWGSRGTRGASSAGTQGSPSALGGPSPRARTGRGDAGRRFTPTDHPVPPL